MILEYTERKRKGKLGYVRVGVSSSAWAVAQGANYPVSIIIKTFSILINATAAG